MNIEKNVNGAVTTLKIIGRLDTGGMVRYTPN